MGFDSSVAVEHILEIRKLGVALLRVVDHIFIRAIFCPVPVNNVGSQNRRRRLLMVRLRRWIELGRAVGALRLLVDGSFITAKTESGDVDAVMLLPSDFAKHLEQGIGAVLELEEMFLTRQPEEIFAAEDEEDFQSWCEFFSRTREADGRCKGLVEILL